MSADTFEPAPLEFKVFEGEDFYESLSLQDADGAPVEDLTGYTFASELRETVDDGSPVVVDLGAGLTITDAPNAEITFDTDKATIKAAVDAVADWGARASNSIELCFSLLATRPSDSKTFLIGRGTFTYQRISTK